MQDATQLHGERQQYKRQVSALHGTARENQNCEPSHRGSTTTPMGGLQ